MSSQSLQSALPPASRRRRDEVAPRPIASTLPTDAAHVRSINESHERCALLGLSRIGAPDYSAAPRADFAVARERNRRLFVHAAPVMEVLFDQIARTQSMVVLTDAQGTVLHSIGDANFLERAATVALAPGVNWAECTKGTNAIGTALVDEVPTLVHADEHFMHANHFLTCQASPILDPRGNIMGVLDVSGDYRGYHPHTMGLVKMSVRMIENHWLNDDFRDALRLHFHQRPEFIGTLTEGILAIDREGRLVGANRGALELLGLSGAALRMHTAASLFGLSLGILADGRRRSRAAPLCLTLPDGRSVHAQVRSAWPVWHPAWGPGAPAERPAVSPRAPVPLQVGGESGAPALRVPAAAHRLPLESGHSPLPTASFARLLTGDPQVAATIEKLRRVADRQIPIMIFGESGSGKEALARAIHAESRRHTRPFVTVQCAAAPEALLEAELFGHAEGASPCGRSEAAIGKLVQASGGTLLLDEVGALPPSLQARLLRVLQDGLVLPRGASSPVGVELTVIAASDRSPRELLTGHVLREDLYYRLCGLSVKLPALRERTDLQALVRQILADESPHRPLSLAPDVEDLLSACDWPGNLRQLRGVLRTAAVMAAGEPVITREHLSHDFLEIASGCDPTAALRREAGGPQRAVQAESPGGTTLEQVERETIRRAVEAANGNISVASKQLGISRNTIYRKLRWRGDGPSALPGG